MIHVWPLSTNGSQHSGILVGKQSEWATTQAGVVLPKTPLESFLVLRVDERSEHAARACIVVLNAPVPADSSNVRVDI
jgi:hypothetical protein